MHRQDAEAAGQIRSDQHTARGTKAGALGIGGCPGGACKQHRLCHKGCCGPGQKAGTE